MSILAELTVYQCDACMNTIVCKNTDSWREFERGWKDSVDHHYCPVCKHFPQVKQQIETDDLVFANLMARALVKKEHLHELFN